MRHPIFLFLTILFLGFGCDSGNETSVVSQEARQKIIQLYGCQVVSTLRPDPKPIEGKTTFLELELLEGKALTVPSVEHVAANASLIAFGGIAPEKRKQLTHIRCLVEGESIPFRYPVRLLEGIENLAPKVAHIDSLLRAGQYEELPELMTPHAQAQLAAELVSTLNAQEQEKGKITESKSMGFKLGKSRLDGEMFDAVSWLFMLKRTGKSTALEVVFPLHTKETRVLSIRTP